MRRESGQLPSQSIANPRNNPSNVHQPSGPSHQSNVPHKQLQFENTKVIFELRSGRIFKDLYQDQVREANTDASQNMNLKEEISTKTNYMKNLNSEPILMLVPI